MNKKMSGKAGIGTDAKIHHKLFNEFMKDERTREAYELESTMFDFIEEIKKEMSKKHLSYYAVAKKAAIDHQVLARVLNGQKNAEVSTLVKVAHGVGAKLNLVLQR